MPATEAKEKIHQAIMKCEGISVQPHRFSGSEYKLGKREIGHVHGNYLVDIPFPIKVRNEVIQNGDAVPHHILPDSGWVSIFLKDEKDVDTAIMLLKKSYELAIEQLNKRKTAVRKT